MSRFLATKAKEGGSDIFSSGSEEEETDSDEDEEEEEKVCRVCQRAQPRMSAGLCDKCGKKDKRQREKRLEREIERVADYESDGERATRLQEEAEADEEANGDTLNHRAVFQQQQQEDEEKEFAAMAKKTKERRRRLRKQQAEAEAEADEDVVEMECDERALASLPSNGRPSSPLQFREIPHSPVPGESSLSSDYVNDEPLAVSQFFLPIPARSAPPPPPKAAPLKSNFAFSVRPFIPGETFAYHGEQYEVVHYTECEVKRGHSGRFDDFNESTREHYSTCRRLSGGTYHLFLLSKQRNAQPLLIDEVLAAETQQRWRRKVGNSEYEEWIGQVISKNNSIRTPDGAVQQVMMHESLYAPLAEKQEKKSVMKRVKAADARLLKTEPYSIYASGLAIDSLRQAFVIRLFTNPTSAATHSNYLKHETMFSEWAKQWGGTDALPNFILHPPLTTSSEMTLQGLFGILLDWLPFFDPFCRVELDKAMRGPSKKKKRAPSGQRRTKTKKVEEDVEEEEEQEEEETEEEEKEKGWRSKRKKGGAANDY